VEVDTPEDRDHQKPEPDPRAQEADPPPRAQTPVVVVLIKRPLRVAQLVNMILRLERAEQLRRQPSARVLQFFLLQTHVAEGVVYQMSGQVHHHQAHGQKAQISGSVLGAVRAVLADWVVGTFVNKEVSHVGENHEVESPSQRVSDLLHACEVQARREPRYGACQQQRPASRADERRDRH